jgi:hypothetical protein
LGWHLVHRGRVPIILVKLRVGLIAVVVGDLNDAVVLKATLECSLGRPCVSGLADMHSASETCGLEETGVDLTELVVNMKWTHPVANLEAEGTAARRVSKGRVETVRVPVLATVVASNDGTPSKRRLVAEVANDKAALVVFELEIIGLVFITATAK